MFSEKAAYLFALKKSTKHVIVHEHLHTTINISSYLSYSTSAPPIQIEVIRRVSARAIQNRSRIPYYIRLSGGITMFLVYKLTKRSEVDLRGNYAKGRSMMSFISKGTTLT